MTWMTRALRNVMLAALVVSALLMGAVGIHEMSVSSPAMAGSSHIMSAPSETALHEHGSPSPAPHTCDGTCETGHALLTVLCVVAGVAMLLMMLLPSADSARVILSSLIRRAAFSLFVKVRATTPSLVQLSISRT